MKRYEKFVLEAEKGINLEVSDGTSGELIIRARTMKNEATNVNLSIPVVLAGEYANVLSIYRDSAGNKAIVPQGWTVSGVPKENIICGKDKSLVIYRIPEAEVVDIDWLHPEELEKLKRTYDQMVWIPVNLLYPSRTLDRLTFYESVKKYGGFYFSRYNISRNMKTSKPQSVKGAVPWKKISSYDAKKVAITFEDNEVVKSQLAFGAEHDLVEEWFFQSDIGYHREIGRVEETGSREEWCINNIYDFVRNMDELLRPREKNRSYDRTDHPRVYSYVAFLTGSLGNCDYTLNYYNNSGFRITLYIN